MIRKPHRHLLTLLLFIVIHDACAKSDSLWNVWSNESNHDTVRLKALDDFIHFNDFSMHHPDSALSYAQTFLDYASKVEDNLYMAKAQTLNGMIQFSRGYVETARAHFQKALELQEKRADAHGAANSLNRIGVTYRNDGKYLDAIAYYRRSIKLQREIGDSIGVARSLQNIANVHLDQGGYDRALNLLKQSMEIMASENEDHMIATVWNNMGVIYNNMGRTDSAIHAYSTGLKIRLDIGDEQGAATTLYNLGIMYYYQGNYNAAIEEFTLGLQYFRKLGDLRTAAQVLNALGQVSRDMGDYVSAIEHNHSALKIREELNDQPGIAQTLVNIGLLYNDQEEYDSALDFCARGLAIFEELDSKKEIGEAMVSMGVVEFGKKEFHRAGEYYSKGLALYQEIGYRQGESIALNNLGLVDMETGNVSSAVDRFKKSVLISEEVGNLQRISHPMTSLSKAYSLQKDYDQARSWGERALSMAKEHGAMNQIQEASHQLYLISKKQGDITKALKMHELYVQMRDSISSEENLKELARFEFKYEYEKKALADSLNAQAEKEALLFNHQITLAHKETERNLYASGGLFLLLITFLFYQRKVNKNKIKMKENEAAYQKELIVATINSQEKERRRIAQDLHDEVGAMLSTIKLQLNAASIQLKINGPENPVQPAVNLVDDTISNVRRISKDLLPPTLEKFGLTHALGELADKVSHASGIAIHKDLVAPTTHLEIERELALYRVIQEMMNNAMKHAEATELRLSLHERNGHIHLTFSDNGKGFDINALKNSSTGQTGLGLKNLENRVGVTGGVMNLKSELGKGTSLEITVPLNSISKVA